MTQFKYFVGIDIASNTFTASVGTMPWKVVLKPQEFENTEDGFQTWLDWLTKHKSCLTKRLFAWKQQVSMVKG
jgi:hypothetical protein